MTAPEKSNVRFPKPKGQRLLKTCRIAGFSMYDGHTLGELLEPGLPLQLEREKDNEYDAKAIAIYYDDESRTAAQGFSDRLPIMLGYVPARENADLSALMDAGWDDIIECRVDSVQRRVPRNGAAFGSDVDGAHSDGTDDKPASPVLDVMVNIYVAEKGSVSASDATVRLMSVSDREARDIQRSLDTRGFVLFSWESFPSGAHNLPAKGDTVLVAQTSDDDTVVRRMFVMAVGVDACSAFDPEVHSEGGRLPFVLTAVSGPHSLPSAQLARIIDLTEPGAGDLTVNEPAAGYGAAHKTTAGQPETELPARVLDDLQHLINLYH